MFLPRMRHETVTSEIDRKVDWQGLGYIVSTVGVLLFGIIAWPTETDPDWHRPVVIAGVVTAILGMAMRYKAHVDQKREVRKAKAEARRS